MPEPTSPEAMKPEWRSGQDAQREDERTSLDEPTPVAVKARRTTLISRFLQKLSRKSQ